MIVFAAGNKIQVSEGQNRIRGRQQPDGRTFWYVDGRRWIKSKKHFSSSELTHFVGEGEPVEIEEVGA